jgi:CHASE3 domain sensor protein
MEEHGDDRRAGSSSLRAVVNTVVGALLVAVVVSALVTASARYVVRTEVEDVQSRLLPARSEAKALAAAHADQEMAYRGYLLSGREQFLDPWDAGVAAATTSVDRLRLLLEDDDRAMGVLDVAVAEQQAWRRDHAEPALAAGPTSGSTSAGDAARAQAQLAEVKAADAALLTVVEKRLDDGFDRIGTWQRIADITVYVAVGSPWSLPGSPCCSCVAA